MKRWSGGVLITFLFILLVLRYGLMDSPLIQRSMLSTFSPNISNPLSWQHFGTPSALQNPGNDTDIIYADTLISNLFTYGNLSSKELELLKLWNYLKKMIGQREVLPHAVEAIREAGTAWKSLMDLVEVANRRHLANITMPQKKEATKCPYSLQEMNASRFDSGEYRLTVPCGLTEGSSITIIGIPGGTLGNFRIDLTGKPLPGEPYAPIVLHYNVRLHGDKLTEDPVIVQNTWTLSQDWGAEERCPSSQSKGKVDDLDRCSSIVGKDDTHTYSSMMQPNTTRHSLMTSGSTRFRQYFPFKQGHLFVATLRVAAEGFQMTVDGKHITSFAYRESLDSWLVNEVRISGNLKLISVLLGGLPTSEDSEFVDLETLKSPPLPVDKLLDLFIGIFSTANNFNRRMAIRRTWMQYHSVRSGAVVVRFFVGLHNNERVNEELWKEACAYGDIQLMPFVDYYSLITLKTIGICIYSAQVISAKYVMKTDDDAFVRVDEIITSLNRTNLTKGLLYGLINSESRPHRSPDSKWYISTEEWPEDNYPPWAHGPGYVVSKDIAEMVCKWHKEERLKMFKLEDVAMGIWIAAMKNVGLDVRYVNDGRIYNEGCQDGYVVAHYQGPREMICLWQKLQEGHNAKCCGERL